MRKTRMRKEPVFETPDGRETGERCNSPRHRRADALAVAVIALGAGAIAVNALLLQAGPHPAPIFVEKTRDSATHRNIAAPAVILPRPRPHNRAVARSDLLNPMPTPTPITASVTLPTPKADPARASRIPSKRVLIVQRVLAEFGYGQIKATGHVDEDTRQAIERFELQHKLPVTGELSERLTKKMTAMTGQSFD